MQKPVKGFLKIDHVHKVGNCFGSVKNNGKFSVCLSVTHSGRMGDRRGSYVIKMKCSYFIVVHFDSFD
jgi:hypothetical protein